MHALRGAPQVMQQGHQLVRAERCALFLVDEEKKELWSKVASGLKESEEIRVKLGEGIAGNVAKTGERMLVKNAYANKQFSRTQDQKNEFVTRDILACPVKNKNGKVIAVVQFINKKPADENDAGSEGGFDENDIKLTELLCCHVGIFIDTVDGTDD